jgi:cobalamin biosynthesis Mg chelatase CobN
MPAERQSTVQKRKRLPFKPPSRRDSAAAEASASAPKTTKAKTTSRKSTAKATATASASTSKNPRKAKSRPSVPAVPSASGSDEDRDGSQSGSEAGSGSDSSNGERSASQEPDYILAEIITNDHQRDIESGEPAIPPKLLTKLLHHHFQNEKTKITKDANAVVAKYVDIFVREALARAAYERAEGDANADTGGGRKSVGDGFLEVCSKLIFIFAIWACSLDYPLDGWD